MSVRVMTAVWELELPDSEKIVLLALADCANDEGHCWPSVASLVRKCSKSERTVQAAVKSLCAKGLLEQRIVPGKGANYTVKPRSGCTTAVTAPPQGTTDTPAAAADKPSVTIKTNKTREHELPEDWRPEPFGERTKSQAVINGWSTEEYETQLEHFRAHHKGHGTKWKDWQDAWSTWVLSWRKFNPKAAAAKPAPPPPPAISDTERIRILEGSIATYQRLGRDTEIGGWQRELAALKSKTEGVPA